MTDTLPVTKEDRRVFCAAVGILRDSKHYEEVMEGMRWTGEVEEITRHRLSSTETLRAERDAMREALWLFREFVIRNATQWECGANHHHPIYPMIAELIGEMGGITSGPEYRFVQPENRQALKDNPHD